MSIEAQNKRQQYQKQYRQLNKARLAKNKKQYNQKHKEEIKSRVGREDQKEIIKECLAYFPTQGTSCLIWKKDIYGGRNKATQCARAGDPAGFKGFHGYWLVTVNRVKYPAHRIVWLLVYGEWPKSHIDHIDRARDNNIVTNLRECEKSTNQQNTNGRKDNSSGFAGVHWSKAASKWVAQIGSKGKQIHLGCFDTPEEAHAVYLKTKQELHPYYTRTNK